MARPSGLTMGPMIGFTLMAGSTIKLFLVDGTPLGPRVIEKSNWSGRGFDFARLDWPTVRSRDDFSKPGVYVLSGLSDDGQPRVYIGEADELRARMNQHFSGVGMKDFWTRAIAFVSKDENLNKAHVRFLESRLVSLGIIAKRALLDNAAVPGLPALSEYDRSEAEAFLAEMLVIYPLLGIDAFAPPTKLGVQGKVLQLAGRGIAASGQDTAEGFVVYAGSRAASTETAGINDYLRKLRMQLIASGVLEVDGSSLRLAQDYTFASPSMASGVMLGRTSNGRLDWRDKTGNTLKAIQELAALG